MTARPPNPSSRPSPDPVRVPVPDPDPVRDPWQAPMRRALAE
ncbi:tRNA-specific adenosine deaminase, partial [Streptomyces cavourensis]